LPVGLYAIVWLHTKFHLGNVLKDMGKRFLGMAKRSKRRLSAMMHRHPHEMNIIESMNDNSMAQITLD
jgi:hypothetical protein